MIDHSVEVNRFHFSWWKIVSWRAITNRAINFRRNWVVRAKDLHAPTSRISCPRWWDSRVTTRTVIHAPMFNPPLFTYESFSSFSSSSFSYEPSHLCASGWTHEQWEDRRDLIRSVRSNMLMKQRCDGGKISTKLLLFQLSEFFYLFVESLLLQSTPRSSLCDKLVVILLLSCRV